MESKDSVFSVSLWFTLLMRSSDKQVAILVGLAVLFVMGGLGALFFSAFYSAFVPATSVAVASTQNAGTADSGALVVTATVAAPVAESPTLTLAPTVEGQPSPTVGAAVGGQTQAAIVSATSAVSQPSSTIPPTQPVIDPPTATSLPSDTPAPGASPTFEDSPTLLLTQVTPPTETATPEPLKDLTTQVELSVAQIQRVQVTGGYILMADIGNLTEQPLKDVSLVFTNAAGARVGEAKPVSLYLPPNDARPGATAVIPATDPIIVNWATVQAHAVGTPVTVQPGQAGYPLALDVDTPIVTVSQSGYAYQATITNNTGGRVAIPYQNVAFFANDGVLLFVSNLGSHAALNDGESYQVTGTISASQAAAEGRALAEYSDVLVIISAEASP